MQSSSQQMQLRSNALSNSTPARFVVEPDAKTRQALADLLGISALKKLRFEGGVTPRGRNGFDLSARLGATIVQPCIVTLEPVTTRIDSNVTRCFVPAGSLNQPEAGSDTEISAEDDAEELGEVIDLEAILREALSLELPDFPRKEGAALGDARFTAQGLTPMSDEDAKPFAGLAALRDSLNKGD